MLKTAEFEGVTQITMGREIEDFGGQVLYWVSAYLVDGLLIDTGVSTHQRSWPTIWWGKNSGVR
jgi:hypothetical protein